MAEINWDFERIKYHSIVRGKDIGTAGVIRADEYPDVVIVYGPVDVKDVTIAALKLTGAEVLSVEAAGMNAFFTAAVRTSNAAAVESTAKAIAKTSSAKT